MDTEVVHELFRAMQMGPAGEERMMALFRNDAVFIEPFSGEPKTHRGLEEIRRAFRAGAGEPPLTLNVDRIDIDGGRLRVEWTCTSPAFPGAMRGVDWFTIVEGKIAELEITVTEMPQ